MLKGNLTGVDGERRRFHPACFGFSVSSSLVMQVTKSNGRFLFPKEVKLSLSNTKVFYVKRKQRRSRSELGPVWHQNIYIRSSSAPVVNQWSTNDILIAKMLLEDKKSWSLLLCPCCCVPAECRLQRWRREQACGDMDTFSR